ncbi:MAG: DUF4159 domain-containing protein [Gemmatimonadota bacterium]|nr:DUF4159 domain-containing protein [Gemmatimonadota bacterium]
MKASSLAVAAGALSLLTWISTGSAEPRPAAAGPGLQEQVPYDGRFTFTRVRYRGNGFGRGWGRSAWAHDYPAADRNMQTMLNEFTATRASSSGSNVFDLEDPGIFLNPILYISEPGYWGTTAEGIANLRTYLLKGGFLIFDDFEARQWDNMAEQVARALPEGVWHEIDSGHPIFSTFFRVEDIYVPHPLVRVTPRYMVIFEDNDPEKRIMILANHNSDLAEYWEYAARGYFPVDPTNDAFRLGINYLIYGMLH